MRLSSRNIVSAALVLALPATGPLAAQQVPQIAPPRVTLDNSDPETQLLGYYAAVLSFRPAGLPDRTGKFALGVVTTYVPNLSDEDRTVSFGGTQTVTGNICTFSPRFSASKAFGRIGLEAAFSPALSNCNVDASSFGGALSYRFPLSPVWDAVVRLSGYSASVDAAITCSASAIADAQNKLCYGGTVSTDNISPLGFSADFVAQHHKPGSTFEPYALAGFRYERVDKDVNYTRTTAQGAAVNLPPITMLDRYEATLARVHLGAGLAWTLGNIFRVGGEALYAPGAVLTFSLNGTVVFGGSR